ncbi:hypothetical protein BOTBODRAFT_52900 [Botryobasidium botryosum FD-172 SS1]|uniref:Translation initiation factor eIF2B subunit epsilon n=1 Tax=Botryobasidium botryosum (strain FD-172 SS1) TaxID=930990 RepID=A0A067N2U4_BOTB1|nr:hypothetical protein BOTBODRAFT_52900 [Botryobasidium botryosum FD-172 SS1]
MPPKAGKEKASDDDDEVLQAVILADSFNSRFSPFTADKPRCLLPLCNAPLLDWTFESLASSGVQEVFVFCCSHSELIKEVISKSKWAKSTSGLSITPIVSPEARSVGDALRDLDAKQIITSDFILITGDVVSNLRIDEIVREHKERKKSADKEAIMTIVMREAAVRDRPRPGTDASIWLLDSNTSRCLGYEYVKAGTSTFKLDREIITQHVDLDVRIDLVDCSIDICAVDVPALFSENFDYQDIRTDFVKGILTSDLLSKTIYCHVAKGGYAARVKDTNAYATISKDFITRRIFPLVPDDNHISGTAYELRKGQVYVAKEGVALSRTCKIGAHTLIGPSVRISDDADVMGSVIGEACTIGRGAVIRNSYVWDGAVIEAGCVIEESIIGNGARIREGSTIGKGCMIGEGVTLGPHARLEKLRKVSRVKPAVDNSWGEDSGVNEAQPAQSDSAILGTEAEAYLWPIGDPTKGDDSEEEDENESAQQIQLGTLGFDASQVDAYTSDASSSIVSSVAGSPASFLSGGSSVVMNDFIIPTFHLGESTSDFKSECTQSLERAFEEGHTVENAAIELKTLRMASNVELELVKDVLVSFLVKHIPIVENAGQQRTEVNKLIGRWGRLVSALGADDAVENLVLFQRHCASAPKYQRIFGLVLAALYNSDVVDEDDIKEWLSNSEARGVGQKKELAPAMSDCLMQGARLLQHLQQMEDSDDEDDSD